MRLNVDQERRAHPASAECAGAEFCEITESDQDKGGAGPAFHHAHQQRAVDHEKDPNSARAVGRDLAIQRLAA